jgi:hypothetical protein
MTGTGLRIELRGASIEEQGRCLRLLLRVPDETSWVWVLDLLSREDLRRSKQGQPWKLHLCQQYYHSPRHQCLVYVWNLHVHGDPLEQAVADLCQFLEMTGSVLKRYQHLQVSLPDPAKKAGSRPDPGRIRSKPASQSRQGVVENGEVVSFPLDPHSLRTVPEGKFGEVGKHQKGAHLVKGTI